MPADVTLAQYALIAICGFGASVIGGVTGYGTGLLMPLVLAPIIGAEAIVPVIAVSALFNNASRVVAFRDVLDRRRAFLLAAGAAPASIVGAFLYTLLSGPAVSVLIGAVLILLVPAKHGLLKIERRLDGASLVVAGVVYGFIVGGTTGSGVLLLAILMAAGLSGRAVVATDAGVTFLVTIAKTLVFQSAGALTPALWIVALTLGAATLPGAFVAKRLTEGLSMKAHTRILDAVVVIGGALLVWQGLSAVWR